MSSNNHTIESLNAEIADKEQRIAMYIAKGGTLSSNAKILDGSDINTSIFLLTNQIRYCKMLLSEKEKQLTNQLSLF